MSVVKPNQSNHSGQSQHTKQNNQSELEANNRRQARENARNQVTIGFSLASDWLRKVAPVFRTNPHVYFRHSIENRSNWSPHSGLRDRKSNLYVCDFWRILSLFYFFCHFPTHQVVSFQRKS